MNEIKIESRISLDEYTRLLFMVTYRKPVVLLISLAGLVLVLLSLLFFLDLYHGAERPPFLPMFTGLLILIIFPVSIYLSARRNFRKEALLKENVHYTLTSDNILLKSDSLSLSVGWDKVHRIRRLGKWILFYRDKVRLNFMIRNCLSDDQENILNRIIKINRLS